MGGPADPDSRNDAQERHVVSTLRHVEKLLVRATRAQANAEATA